MAYNKQEWTDGSGGGTPLSATRLDYMEEGIRAAAAAADGKAPASHTHPIADLTATGPRSSSTFLRGDGTWAIPPGDGSGGGTGGAWVVVAGDQLDTARPDTTGPVVWYATGDPVNADATQDVTNYVSADGTSGDGSHAHLADYVPAVVLTGPGIDPTGATDSTAAIQAKIDAAAATKAVVHAPPGTYLVAGLTLRAYTTLSGAGPEKTVFKLPAGSTNDVLVSDDVDTLIGSNTSGGPAGVTLDGFTIHGNKSAAPSGGWGLRKYGYRWTIENVQVRDCAGGGIYSEWSHVPGNGADGGFMEDHLGGLRVHSNTGFGIQWRGPHDTRIDNALIYTNTGVGLSIEGSDTYHAGNIICDGVHSYGNGGHGVQTISTNNQGASINAGILISESNGGSGFFMAANGSIISSGNFYGNTLHGVDVQGFAAGYMVNAVCYNNTGSQLKFTADGGNGFVTLASYTASAGQVAISGTRSDATVLQVTGTGEGTNRHALAVPGIIDATQDGIRLLAALRNRPVVDLAGETGFVGREVFRATGAADSDHVQFTVNKELRVVNSDGVEQPLRVGVLTAVSGGTFSGVIWFADSAQLRLPTAPQTDAGRIWYDEATGALKYRDGVANVTRTVTST